MKKLAILSSDRGVNLEAIVEHFNNVKSFNVEIVLVTDNVNSGVLKRAQGLGLKTKYLPPEENRNYFANNDFDLIAIDDYKTELKPNVLEVGRFINIHESLLPAFKGTDALARAFSAGVKVSGVTVHWCTNEIDGGKIIAQYPILISNLMHFDEFKSAIENLQNHLYPVVIEKVLEDKVFDFEDLFNEHKSSCGGDCSSCGGCENH